MGLKIPIRWAALSPNQLRSVEGEDPDSNINSIARIESHVFFAPFLHSLHRRVVGSQLAAKSPFLGDSASQFVQKMRTLLIATEESHFLLRLFKCSILTLDSIKDCIAQSFADIFCGKSNIDFFDQRHDGVLPCALQDIIETVGDQCQQQNKDCFSQRKDCNDKRDLRADFNVLDTMLKDSLERLKMMREGISWAHIGLCGRTFEGSYTQHVAIIRALCLEGNGDTMQALAFWDEMLQRDEGRIDEACYIYSVMSRMGVAPDHISYKMLIQGLCIQGHVIEANEFLVSMLENLIVPEPLIWNSIIDGYGRRSMDKTLEHLRRDERDVLDKSGPKIIRHKPITALLSPTELDPYIPLHTASEDLVFTGIRNCCEILEKGHSKSIGSFPVSILRPFSEDLDCSEFNTLLKRMMHEKLKWDNSFNVRGISTHLQSPIWIFWLNDVLSTFAPILKKCGIYAAIYVSQFAYARNVSLLKGFLERWSPDTNTFHTIYGELGISLWDLHRISGLPIRGEFYEEFTPSNDILYSSQTSKACRGLFNIYASSCQSKKFNHWTFKFIDESPTSISGFQRKDRIPDDVYLSGFLASWLSGFVFPHSSGEIRPTTFHVATKMAGGTLFSLAIPVLAYLYHCLGKMASSSSPGKENIQGPLHYLFGWISLYFVKTYSHGDPQLICPIPDIHFMPYLGFIGNQSAAQFFNDKFPFVNSLLTYRTECQFRALTHESEPSGILVDSERISYFHLGYLISLRQGVLTFKMGFNFISEPYSPNRFGRQFGFAQACPTPLNVSCRQPSEWAKFYYNWRHMLRCGTKVSLELPGSRSTSHVTMPYANWWLGTSFTVLQYITHSQSKSSRKRKLDMSIKDRKTKNPPYSRARSSSSPIALEASSLQRMDNSRPLIAPSRSSYSASDLLHLFEDMCNSQFKMRFSFEQADSGPQFSSLAKLFPETMSISDCTGTSQPTVATKTPMDQFRTYLYSFLEDENMIQELFEGDGYELTALGRIRIKSVEIPSPTKSFDCSLNGSNESEDEFYDYTPFLNGTPTKMSKLPSANVAFSSPSNEPSKLLEKDHATLQNSWSTCGNHNLSPPPPKSLPAVHQESTSDTLEETDEINPDTSEEAQILADLLEANGVNKLFDKLEAPFASSGLLLGTSSNEAATHIQKGLTISLQSMTDVNGMIAVANNVFMILKSLGVDFISFYEKVKIFLGCFALKTQLADSSNLSTAEFEAQYCEKKLHFDKVSGEHEQLSASIIKSDEQIAGLNQRIIQTKELLKQLEEELSSTQAEHAVILHKLPRVFLNQKKTSKLL
ncbi:unnamed protein product [Camellia sinensis]